MTETVARKRSPRAPTISLKEAIDRVSKVYEMEGRHPSSVDIVANNLGYKSSENGAARRVLAALGYYGLLDRPSEGKLAVSKSFEDFKFSPNEDLRVLSLRKWLSTPPVFAELIEKFQDRLPSEATLKYELIQMGFSPTSAAECLAAFIESMQYLQSISSQIGLGGDAKSELESDDQVVGGVDSGGDQYASSGTRNQSGNEPLTNTQRGMVVGEGCDQIPVRLEGGRRAWLVIPSPFYVADKRRLVSQIELLLADDE